MGSYRILQGHKDLKGQLLQAYGSVLNFSVTKSLTDLQGWFLEGHAPLKKWEIETWAFVRKLLLLKAGLHNPVSSI